MERPDNQLIKDYFRGDEKAFEVLIKRYLKPIYGFVYRFVGDGGRAEDITQDVFVKVWRNLKKFNQDKKFKTWIFAIAKNTTIDFLKKKKVIPFCEFENEKGENVLVRTLTDPAPLAQELSEKTEIARELQGTLATLSPKYRIVLLLRYNEHFNFREIAQTLGEPFNTIKSRHRRALILLKRILWT